MNQKRVPKKRQRRAESSEAPRPAAGGPAWWRFALAALGLVALVGIAYGNGLDNGFVWDDHEQVVMNPYVKAIAPLAPLFAGDVRFARQNQGETTSVYRPLQLLTYRVAEDWSDGGAEAFHLCSMLLAMAGALAAFAMFWLLTKRLGLAFAAAALFAVHPVHTEAVDWIAASPDLGCGLFILLAFAGFLAARNVAGSAARRWLWWGSSLAAFAIALLWKETAVVFPVLIASYVAVVEKGAGSRLRRAATASAPYWILLAVYLAIRVAVLGGLSAGARDWMLTPLQSALTMLHLMMLYGAKLVLPVGLNVYHVFHPIRSISDARGWIALVVATAAATGIVWLVRRAPLLGFAAIWVVLTLAPAMNLNGLGRNAFAERYLYLPSAGFCLLLAAGAAWLIGRLPNDFRRGVGAGLLVVALAGFSVEDIVRNRDWKDDATLFARTLPQSPDAPFVRYMVATTQSGDPAHSEEAERNFVQTIALAKDQIPTDRLDMVKGYEGLASLYADRGQVEQALQMLEMARAIAPDDPDIAGEEGIIRAKAGNGASSEESLNRALAAQPNNENVLSALGLIARDEHHDLKRAELLFSKALAVHPQRDDFNASLHNNLAAIYGDQGDFVRAIAEMRQAVSILPGDPEFHLNLASALAATGHFAEARTEAETALKIAPGDGNAQEILRRLDEAPAPRH